MRMTIDEMISFCEEEEHNHRISCKRYDDASGYTRSKDKNIRTAVAIREEVYGDFYKQIADTMRKYQKIQEILNSAGYIKNGAVYSYTYDEDSRVKHIREVVEDGNVQNDNNA